MRHSLTPIVISLFAMAAVKGAPVPTSAGEGLGWKEHFIRQGDGRDGWITTPARYQILHHPEGGWCPPFGVAQMDNQEVVLVGSWEPGNGKAGATYVAFSTDRGATWTDLTNIPNLSSCHDWTKSGLAFSHAGSSGEGSGAANVLPARTAAMSMLDAKPGKSFMAILPCASARAWPGSSCYLRRGTHIIGWQPVVRKRLLPSDTAANAGVFKRLRRDRGQELGIGLWHTIRSLSNSHGLAALRRRSRSRGSQECGTARRLHPRRAV